MDRMLKIYQSPGLPSFLAVPVHFAAWCVLLLAGLVQWSSAQDAESTEPPVTAKSLEAISEKIFTTKRSISAESTQWEEQRALFADLIEIREKEIAEIDTFTASAKERVEDVKQQREALNQEEAERKAWRADFQGRIEALEEQLRQALPRLPQPVMDKVEQASGRLKLADEQAPLQERFRDILAILSAVQDFSNRITVVKEIREFDGREVEIEVMYLGLSQAWFANRNGQVAGIGWPSGEGWKWEQNRSLGSKIRSAINVQRREAPAEMVRLPFRPVSP